jgi:hypothetical protein
MSANIQATLYKKYLGRANTNNFIDNEYTVNADPYTYNNRLFSQIIPSTAPDLSNTQLIIPGNTDIINGYYQIPKDNNFNYIKKYTNVKLTALKNQIGYYVYKDESVQGQQNTNLLTKVIKPSVDSVGNTYNIILYADNKQIFISDYILDTDAGVLQITANGLILTSNIRITFWRYEGELGLSHITNRLSHIINFKSDPNRGYYLYSDVDDNDNLIWKVGSNNVTIGTQSASENNNTDIIAVGPGAGTNGSGNYTVTVGSYTNGATIDAQTSQKIGAIAIGRLTGKDGQGLHAIAIGTEAGLSNQSNYSIAIGYEAGKSNTGLNSILIGRNANTSNNNSIVLNATGSNLIGKSSGLYIDPIRNRSLAPTNFTHMLYYDTTNKEIAFGEISGGGGESVSNWSTYRANTNIDMSNHSIINLCNIDSNSGLSANGTHAVNRNYVDSNFLKLSNSISQTLRTPITFDLSGVNTITMNQNIITGLRNNPSSASDAVNCNFVMSNVSNWSRFVATSNLNVGNYNITNISGTTYTSYSNADASTKITLNSNVANIKFVVDYVACNASGSGSSTIDTTNFVKKNEGNTMMSGAYISYNSGFNDYINGINLNTVINGLSPGITDFSSFVVNKGFLDNNLLNYLDLSGIKSMKGTLNMSGNKITSLATGTVSGDAVNFSQLQAIDPSGKFLLLSGGNLSGILNMSGNKITSLATGTVSEDAVNFSQLQAIDPSGKFLLLSGGNLSGTLNMSGNIITNLKNPSNNEDAVNKFYVDNKLPLSDISSSYLYWENNKWVVGSSNIRIGTNAGLISQGDYAVAIGNEVGYNNQGATAVSIGHSAGNLNQGMHSVSIGLGAGYNNQNVNAIAIGNHAGAMTQNENAVAIGNHAGFENQGSNAIAIGNGAGFCNQPNNSIIINATNDVLNENQSNAFYVKPIRESSNMYGLYYDYNSGEITYSDVNNSTNGNSGGISVDGLNYGEYLFYDPSEVILNNKWKVGGNNAINIGLNSGRYANSNNRTGSIAIGIESARSNQNINAIAIGRFAGDNSQNSETIAIGNLAGQLKQSRKAIAIGRQAGMFEQGEYAISIGEAAGAYNAYSNSIAIGHQAGFCNQGVNSICIGNLAGHSIISGEYQADNSIILNATGKSFIGVDPSGLYIKPIRSGVTNNVLFYDEFTGEIKYSTTSSNGITLEQASNAASNVISQKFDIAPIKIGLSISNIQSNNTIVLNATSNNAIQTNMNNAFYVKPIREASNIYGLYYNSNTGEITYCNVPGLKNILDICNVANTFINMSNNTITNLRDPSDNEDAVNKQYVDNRLPSGTIPSSYLYWENNKWAIGSSNIRIGTNAGLISQGEYAVAIGNIAGMMFQGLNAIAIGNNAGCNNQNSNAVAIGNNAGYDNQGLNAIALGSNAGNISQGSNAVAIGKNAGNTSQGLNAVAIGNEVGTNNQKPAAISIGHFAGNTDQENNAIAIGNAAAQINQQCNAIAVGNNAGYANQQSNAIAVGANAGRTSQGVFAIAMGTNAGQSNQGSNAVAIGRNAGNLNQPNNSIIINAINSALNGNEPNAFYVKPIREASNIHGLYYNASSGEITYNIASTNELGSSLPSASNESSYLYYSAADSKWKVGTDNIKIGANAGLLNQGSNAVAIGNSAGAFDQISNAVAIGNYAGQENQSFSAVAIGDFAGKISQNEYAIAIGSDAGMNYQSNYAIAIGNNAGFSNQGIQSVAIGTSAGVFAQQNAAIALGLYAGNSNQGSNAIAIGKETGAINQGSNAIAIGNKAGQSNQPNNSIIINATDIALNGNQFNAFYVKPIRQHSTALVLYYDSGSGEITYSNAPTSGSGTICGSIIPNGTSNSDYLYWNNGEWTVGSNIVRLGRNAGATNLGSNSIAIGNSASFNGNNFINTIVLNAQDIELNPNISNAFYVKPIRSSSNASMLYYNSSSGEITYSTAPTTLPTATINGSYLYYNGSQWVVGTNNIRLGTNAGSTSQGFSSIAIGDQAGKKQGFYSIALGVLAGCSGNNNNTQGDKSVAIGYLAGNQTMHNNSIVINASDNALDTSTSNAFYVKPIRNSSNSSMLYYNSSTGEITHSNVPIGSYFPTATINGSYLYYNDSQWVVGTDTIKIGTNAGNTLQGSNAIAIGASAGSTSQGTNSIAIGAGAGLTLQGLNSIAIGTNAGNSIQLSETIALGINAAQSNQQQFAIAVGGDAGRISQGRSAIAIGRLAGITSQNSNSIAIGQSAGSSNQSFNSIAIGQSAGITSQNSNSIAIGAGAGSSNQSFNSIAIGANAGVISQNNNSIAIGAGAGSNNQSLNSIAIGQFAGITSQNSNSIAIGAGAGSSNQSLNSIAIGQSAGITSQNSNSIAIGAGAGRLNQGTHCVTIGHFAGYTSQGELSLALGAYAGENNQDAFSVAIGAGAGRNNQSIYSVALGYDAGSDKQSNNSVALGYFSGRSSQGMFSVAIGDSAGEVTQGNGAVSIGASAGEQLQGMNTVAIGANAGRYNQGEYAIAIGNNAGYSNQHKNTIIINATANEMPSDAPDSTYIAPIRQRLKHALCMPLFWDPLTSEVFIEVV